MPDLPPSLVILTVVATGAVLAGFARLVLPASRRLAWSTTIVAAVLGAAVAWLPLDLAGQPPVGWVRALVGIAGAVLAVGVSTTVLLAWKRRRARGVVDATVEDLLAAGEGERVEFKSTARWNLGTAAKDARMEEEVALTVAGFMNATGGTLLIGVDDEAKPLGIAPDLAVVPGGDRDGFELWLRTMLAERLGRAVSADVGVAFAEAGEATVCRVDVAPADRPVFVGSTRGGRAADFYLRVGNSTRRLLTDEVLEYQARRWR